MEHIPADDLPVDLRGLEDILGFCADLIQLPVDLTAGILQKRQIGGDGLFGISALKGAAERSVEDTHDPDDQNKQYDHDPEQYAPHPKHAQHGTDDQDPSARIHCASPPSSENSDPIPLKTL